MTAVYRSRAATQSVLHTHSPHLTAFALLVTLEEAAAAELRALALGGARDLPPGTFADG
ncbi:MAG TPA: class II aldolase/adducin family protein [Acidimicrobiales bacterium]|nr:class II aldolase/adducin family protein [Acidimicrobiales bacterium]